MGGTSAEMVTKSIYLELFGTTSGKQQLHQKGKRNLCSNGRVKKGLSQTSRPDLVSVMSPDLSQPPDCLEPSDTSGVILFLRLEVKTRIRTTFPTLMCDVQVTH
jgi:hypothetical protein